MQYIQTTKESYIPQLVEGLTKRLFPEENESAEEVKARTKFAERANQLANSESQENAYELFMHIFS